MWLECLSVGVLLGSSIVPKSCCMPNKPDILVFFYITSSAPSAPRLLRVVDSASCQLDWLPPASPNGAVTYTVQYQTSSGGSFMNVATGLTTTHHTAVNLPFGTSVTLRVRAVNSAGMSDSNTTELQGMYGFVIFRVRKFCT